MGNRFSGTSRFLICTFFQACLVSGALLYAQETPAGDYFFQKRFVQRLSWEHDPLVFRYEVILEEEWDGEYRTVQRKSTQEHSLELSLRPGRYRYAVEVYNLFRRLEYTMDWVYFTVLNALKPEILTFSPEAFFLGARSKRQLTITGRNIAPDALIMLRPLGGSSAEDGQGIRPLNTTFKGDTARLTFDNETLAPGAYDVYVRNPGGLEDSKGIFRVLPGQESEASGGQTANARSRRPDIIISAGYAPVIPLYGSLFSDGAFIRPVFTGPIFPLGAAARVGLLPLKRDWGYVGVELNASWFKMEEQTKYYMVAAQDIAAHVGLLYQLWLPKRIMAINFRLGAGVNLVTDFYFDYGDGREDPLTSLYLSLDAGLSFQWHIKGPFFIDAGVDFTHVLSLDDHSQPGYLRPALSLGWQF
jgi:hypothetical protein